MSLFKTIKNLMWRRSLWMALFGLMLVLNSFIVLAYISGNRNQLIYSPYVKAGLPLYRSLRELGNSAVNLAYVFAMRREVGIPQYRLDIKSGDLRKLNDVIPSSLSDGVISGQTILDENLNDAVPGVFTYNNQTYEVKVHYRGLNANHWTRPKKSWQIKFDKDTPFAGLRTLKLIIPDDRGYFAEMLNNYRADKLGLAFPQAELAQLYVNNDYQGVYFSVEDFTAEFLERNARPADANIYTTNDQPGLNRESFTVFDDINYWRKQASDGLFGYENFSELDFLLARLQSADFAKSATDIIDMDSFYSWNIVALLAGSNHQSSWGNMRLYFNNAKGKFEFINWDVGIKSYLPTQLTNAIADKILANPEFYLERNQRLWNYVKDDNNLADDLQYYDELYNKVKPAFYSDFKKFDNNLTFNRRVAEVRSQHVNIINNIRELFSQNDASLDIRHDGRERLITFSFRLDNFSGLALQEIILPFVGVTAATLYADSNANNVWDSQDAVVARAAVADGKFILSGLNYYVSAPVFVRYEGNIIKDISQISYSVANAVTGENVNMNSVQLSDLTTFATFSDISLTVDEFVKKQPIFKKHGAGLVLPAGSYVFNSDIVVPKNTTLYIEPGVNITLAPDVSLVSYSPVIAKGTKERAIILRPLTPGAPWGSFGILNNGAKKSTLEYVNIAGGSTDYINGVNLIGMVSIYYSDADINQSVFSESQSDDGVNFKYANILVADSTFKNNSADGLDVDYDSGVIRDSEFTNNGNDGIDLSGSKMVIKNNRIKSSGDKCISIGENTLDTFVFNTIMDSCHIGVQAKDNSKPVVINSVIINNDIGVDAYQKKGIYLTGGHPVIYNSIIRDNKEQAKQDAASSIKILFSNISGGVAGENNFDENNNYLDIQNRGRGDAGIIKQYLNIDAKEAPVGLWEKF